MAATPANTPPTIDYSGLAALLPAYQAEYESLAPGIERSVMNNAAANGMANSGSTQQVAAQQEQQLLASLANQSAGQQETDTQNQANRDAASASANKQMIGSGISAGLGGLGSLGGMYYMLNKMGGKGVGVGSGTTDASAAAGADAGPMGVNGVEGINPSVSGVDSNLGSDSAAPAAQGGMMQGSPWEGVGLGLAGAGLGYGLGSALGGGKGGIYGGIAGGLTGLGGAGLMGAFS